MTASAQTGRRHAIAASAAQAAAARPDASVWVSANAGSGKTRVLTNRVARLLLAGAAPSRILCLTYTKAAAAEMRDRLFKTLGDWALSDDERLFAALDGLLAEDEPAPTPETLGEARKLFAQALETPGGLKIQTIHAFCESLLSRFPLEAGVPPRFSVLDDVEADMTAQEALDGLVVDRSENPREAEAFARVTLALDEIGMEALLRAARGMARAYRVSGDDPVALARALGAPSEPLEVRIAAATPDAAQCADWAELYASGGKADLKLAEGFRAAAAAADPVERFDALAATVLTAEGRPRAQLGGKAVRERAPAAVDAAAAVAADIESVRSGEAARAVVERSGDLGVLARGVLARFDALKRARAKLDYDDLIDRAVGLLTRSDARDWVRYKLDGGVEHILVDEAQDTSPEQWAAIAAIAEEFFAGAGADRGGRGPRTLFAVGDEKQSIYSFQGAAPAQLAEMGAHFAARAAASGLRFERGALDTSFRSAPAILTFVDRVFAPDAARAGLVFGEEGRVAHRAFRAGHPGRVDIWPVLEKAAAEAEAPWWSPLDAPSPDHPELRLARMVAETIAGWIGTEPLPARDRAMRAGDVLVLVRRRGRLSAEILKSLKRLGAPVAGSDRLSLERELAVKDLIALARFCLFPEDDLTVATVLRSPLCDVGEAALFELAHRRPPRRPLYYALQDRRSESPAYADAYARLAEIQKRADFDRPFEVLQHALGPMGGRARMAARLGPEAEDAIDELLAEALRLEQSDSPTLQSLVGAMAARRGDLKREHEQGRDEVRIMTVHGAKGLEAPVVVLPDTMSSGAARGPALLDSRTAGLPPIWPTASKSDNSEIAEIRALAAARDAEERRRLLYVALTRAEDRLLICGAANAAPKDPAIDDSWHSLCWTAASEGFEPMDWPGSAESGGRKARARVEDGPGRAPGSTAAAAKPPVVEPDWLRRAAVAEIAPADVAPSHLEDAAALEDSPSAPTSRLDPRTAARRGEAVHALLEHDYGDDAHSVLARLTPDLSEALRADAAAEAAAVRSRPEFAALFGPNSRGEVPIAAVSADLGPGEIHGVVDRILVEADRVLIVDFKTGVAPESPPATYARQLAVYRAAAKLAFPDKAVAAGLLWTAIPRLDVLSSDILDEALSAARAALDQRRRRS